MEKCGSGCLNLICDFCENYSHRSIVEGLYSGDGFCNLLKVNKGPDEGCEDFKCFRVKIIEQGELK
jgi:hypothetical protein